MTMYNIQSSPTVEYTVQYNVGVYEVHIHSPVSTCEKRNHLWTVTTVDQFRLHIKLAHHSFSCEMTKSFFVASEISLRYTSVSLAQSLTLLENLARDCASVFCSNF